MASKVSWKKDKRLQRILKQNAERRAEERREQGEGKILEPVVMTVVIAGSVVGGIFVIVAGIAGLLLTLLAVIIGAFTISGMFKD